MVAVPVRFPVMIPLLIITPDIAVADATYKLPPIPTPPVTVNAPDNGLIEAVEPDTPAATVFTETPAENVFVVSVFEAGLNNSPASEETAIPDADPDAGVNKI